MWLRVRWEVWESSPVFLSCLHHASVWSSPWAVWCCSISLELRRSMSYALRNKDCVLQRGFLLTVLVCTNWLWLSPFHFVKDSLKVVAQLFVPHVTEFAAVVVLCLTSQMWHTFGVLLVHLVFPTCQGRRTGTSWLTANKLQINHLKEPDALILILQKARGEELRCPSTL